MKKIVFQSDGLNLTGVLHLPNRPLPPFVVGSHGLFSDGDSPKQVRLAQRLFEQGVAFFRFDHRGCGKSEGNFAEVTSLQGRAADIWNAVETLRSREGMGPFLGLFGSSMGGAASLHVAGGLFEVPAIVTVAAPVRSRDISSSGKNREPDPLAMDLVERKTLEFDLADRLCRIRNILIFHGDADETVPFSHALEIHKEAGEPKRLIRFLGGDHRMSEPDHQIVFIEEASRWFLKNPGFFNP